MTSDESTPDENGTTGENIVTDEDNAGAGFGVHGRIDQVDLQSEMKRS